MSETPSMPQGTVAQALNALKNNPIIVGVLLLNMLFVGVAAWYLIHDNSLRYEHLKMILDRCLPGGSR